MALTLGTTGMYEKKYKVFISDLTTYDMSAANDSTLALMTSFSEIVAQLKSVVFASRDANWVNDYKLFRNQMVQVGVTKTDATKIGTEDDGDIDTTELGKVILGKKGSVAFEINPSSVADINQLRNLHGTILDMIFEGSDAMNANNTNTALFVGSIGYGYEDEFKGNDTIKVMANLSKPIANAASFVTIIDSALDIS